MQIKKNKKISLKILRRNWLTITIAFLFRNTMIILASLTTRNIMHVKHSMHFSNILTFILYIFLDPPLTIGLSSYYLKLSRNEFASELEIFKFIKTYKKCFKLVWYTRLNALAWSVLLFFPGLISIYRYKFSYFLFIDNRELEIKEILDLSRKYSKNRKIDMLMLDLSYIIWWFFTLITLFIPLPFLLAYIRLSFTNIYNETLEKNKQTV